MRKVLIIGAHGKVGHKVSDQLNAAAEFNPKAMRRKDSTIGKITAFNQGEVKNEDAI